MLFHSALESSTLCIGWASGHFRRFKPSIVFNMESCERLCYYSWTITKNFAAHRTITTIDCIFEQVGELEKYERAVTDANLFEVDYILPFQVWCLHHT